MSLFFDGFGDLRIGWMLILTLVVGVGLVFVVGFGASYMDFLSTRRGCEQWQQKLDRETRFVEDFTWYWECAVKTDSGFIPVDQLQQVETPNVNIK